MTRPLVTVVVPTFNGETYLNDLLAMCARQETSFPFDVLVIDSGSTDRTLEIVRSHRGVRLHEIPNHEFGHGRTRNLGASMAPGEFVAYLVQDAVPASEHWLASLIEPLEQHPRVAAVYGRQVPRPDCCIAVKRDVRAVFDGLDTGARIRIDGRDAENGASGVGTDRFFSDVNSAGRLAVWRQIPFRDVAYAEDRALANDLLDAGWLKAYAPCAAVQHSHNLALGAYHRRMREEFAGLRSVGVPVRDGLLRLAASASVTALQSVTAALSDPDYRAAMRLRQALLAPLYSAARVAAIRQSRQA